MISLMAALSDSLKIQEHCCILFHEGKHMHKKKKIFLKEMCCYHHENLRCLCQQQLTLASWGFCCTMHCEKFISVSFQWILQHKLKTTVICSQGADVVIVVEGIHPTTWKHFSTNSCGMGHFTTAWKNFGFKG